MTIIGELIVKVREAAHNETVLAGDCRYGEGRVLREAISAIIEFSRDYEDVTVRSLGGSLEIGRPVGDGHHYWISEEGAKAVPALMLKRNPKSANILGVAKALYHNGELLNGAREPVPWDQASDRTQRRWLAQARVAAEGLSRL